MIPYCCQFKGEPILILTQRGKALNVLGFTPLSDDALQVFTKEGSINAEFIINSIHAFANSLIKTTVLVLDNARIHHAKIVQSCIEAWEEKGLYVFYLLAYSPHLNRIERLWKESTYRWAPPSAYANRSTLEQKLDEIWAKFGGNYKINFPQQKS